MEPSGQDKKSEPSETITESKYDYITSIGVTNIREMICVLLEVENE